MKKQPQGKGDLPAFNRATVFAEVDKSNRRFEDYSKEDRESFAAEARAQKIGVHEVRRTRH